MAASFGKVRLDCPICGRPFEVHFDLDTSDSGVRGKNYCLGHIAIREQDVYAHLLTHGQHDGEPLELAA